MNLLSLHTHTHLVRVGGGGLFDLPCTQGQLLMDAKLSLGPLNTKTILSPKITLFGLHKIACVHGNPLGTAAGSEARPNHLQTDPRSTFASCKFCRGYFPSSIHSRKTSYQ